MSAVWKKRPGQRQRHRRAAAILELALTLPLFILITLGIFEFGRAMMVEQIITNAAREAARRAVTAGATDAQVFTTIDTYLTNHGISGQTRTIKDSGGTATSIATIAAGDPIVVTVSIPYTSVDWGLTTFLGDNTLSSTVVMRKE